MHERESRLAADVAALKTKERTHLEWELEYARSEGDEVTVNDLEERQRVAEETLKRLSSWVTAT